MGNSDGFLQDVKTRRSMAYYYSVIRWERRNPVDPCNIDENGSIGEFISKCIFKCKLLWVTILNGNEIVFIPGYYIKRNYEYMGSSAEKISLQKRLWFFTPKNQDVNGEQTYQLDIAMKLSRTLGPVLNYRIESSELWWMLDCWVEIYPRNCERK